MSAETSGSDRDTEGQDADVLALMREIGPIVEERRHYGLNREDAEVYARTVLASDWLAAYVARKVETARREQEELDLAMHHAYRPEVVTEVAVNLSDHAEWDRLAEWCGGRIETGQEPSGEYSSTLVLPNGECGGEWSWLVLDHAGEFHIRAVVEAPTTTRRSDQWERIARRLRRMLTHSRWERDEARAVIERVPHCPTCTCGCTCGYGGQHEPENPRCDLNALVPATEPASDQPLTLDEHLAEVERRLWGPGVMPESLAMIDDATHERVPWSVLAVRAYREEVRRG